MICLDPKDPWYGQDNGTYGQYESMHRFTPDMFTNGVCNVPSDCCYGMTLEQINTPTPNEKWGN
jgi:hypothetical protein